MNPRTDNIKRLTMKTVFAAFALFALGVQAEEPVEYVAPVYNGTDGNPTNGIAYWTTNSVSAYTMVETSDSAVTWGEEGATNWFVVGAGEYVQIDGGIICKGHVNLILCEDANFFVIEAENGAAGIATDPDGSFTVYGRPDGAGSLEVSGGENGAGIGGGEACDGSNITINDGMVKAYAVESGLSGGAGIGGGCYGSGANITINGGTVVAYGAGEYECGAGIGGGGAGAGSNITLNGGTIMAFGAGDDESGRANCIGCGTGGWSAGGIRVASSANVIFNLTNAEPNPPQDFVGCMIMTPEPPPSSYDMISGIADWTGATTFKLRVMSTAEESTAVVNGGLFPFSNKQFSIRIGEGVLRFAQATEIAPPQVDHTTYAIFTNDVVAVSNKSIVVENRTPAYVVYSAEEGYVFKDGATAVTNVYWTDTIPATNSKSMPEAPTKLTIVACVVPEYIGGVASNGIARWYTTNVPVRVVEASASRVTWDAGWYVVTNDVEIIGGADVNGAVNLILADGAKLTMTNGVAESKAGITVKNGNSFAVYGQAEGTGALDVTGGKYGAGIGGNSDGAGSNITINGGTVTATGRSNGAGIGGGEIGDGSNITINGGTVTARCLGYGGAGIGGGQQGDGRDIVINGGTVSAIGAIKAAGIGGGSGRIGYNIALNGGVIRVASPRNFDSFQWKNAELLGSGFRAASSTGVVISASAKVLFNVTGYDGHESIDPLMDSPAEFDGLVIMTPKKLEMERVLASGIAGLTTATVLTMTNAVTAETATISVGGGKVPFSDVYCSIAYENDTLKFVPVAVVMTIMQQPHATNGYEVVAMTDSSEGIVNYAWMHVDAGTSVGFETLTNRLFYGSHSSIIGTSIQGEWMFELDWCTTDFPADGAFYFTCSVPLVDVYNFLGMGDLCGTLKKGIGENGWIYTPNPVDGYYVLPLMRADAEQEPFAIENLEYRYGVNVEEVAEGSTMTKFPAGSGVEGECYYSCVKYGHNGRTNSVDSTYFIYIPVDLAESIPSAPTAVANATFSVFTNDVKSADGIVISNEAATVVYTADEYCFFADGETVVTNALDTSVNPAVNKDGANPGDARPYTHFVETAYAVREGGSVKVCVRGGSADTAVQATLVYVKGPGSFKAAYVDGKEATFPLTLGWAKGEASTKEIVFSTANDKESDYDRFFTLQLTAPVGEDILGKKDVCTVTLKDAGGVREQYDYVRALTYPANAGTVTGAGKLTAKTTKRTLVAESAGIGTFKGWYPAKADDPTSPDLKKRLTKKAKYTATEAGTYFACYTDVLPVPAVVPPDAGSVDAEGVEYDEETGTYIGTVGVKFRLPCTCTEDGTLKATGRPVGIAWDKDEDTLTGVPTEVGTFNVKFTATNAAGSHTVRYRFEIRPLEKNAIGTWTGVIRDTALNPGIGAITVTVGETGRISAKVTTRTAGDQLFKGEGYDQLGDGYYGLDLYSKGGETLEIKLDLLAGWGEPQIYGYYDVSESKFWGDYPESGDFALVRNPYDEEEGDPKARQLLAAYVALYEEALMRNGKENGEVSFRVKSSGTVIVKATVGSNTAFSGTVAGGLKVWKDGTGTIEAALRSEDKRIWSADAQLDSVTRGAEGESRYIMKSGDERFHVFGKAEPK